MSVGCGRFTEEQWSDFLFAPQGATELQAHLATCQACRREADGLRSTARHLSKIPASHPAAQTAFVDRVLAETAVFGGDAIASATVRGGGVSAQPRMQMPGGLRTGKSSWRLPHAVLSTVAAACIVLVVALGTGQISWQLGTRSATPLRSHSISVEVLYAVEDTSARVTTHGVTRETVPSGILDWLHTEAEPLRQTPGVTILAEEDRT